MEQPLLPKIQGYFRKGISTTIGMVVATGCATAPSHKPVNESTGAPVELATEGITDIHSERWLPLAPEEREKITSTRAVLTLDHSDLRRAIGTPAEPVAKYLLRDAVGEILLIQLFPQLPQVPGLALASLHRMLSNEFNLDALLARTEESHILHLEGRLLFANDFSEWWIESHNVLYPTGATASPIYRNTTVFQASLDEAHVEETGDAIELWLADNRKRLTTALDQGSPGCPPTTSTGPTSKGRVSSVRQEG